MSIVYSVPGAFPKKPSSGNSGKLFADERNGRHMSQAARLKQTRLSAGYETAAEAVRAHKLIGSTYYAHENGERGLSDDSAHLYGAAFGVSPLWLKYGVEGQPAPGVPQAEIDLDFLRYSTVFALHQAGLPLAGAIQTTEAIFAAARKRR